MGRKPTKQLTLSFVLRTLKRLQMVTRLDQVHLAEELIAQHVNVQGLGEYLCDVAEYMKAKGYDPYGRRNVACAQCGNEILRDHNGARYCSTSCRQRAYRVRKATAEGRNSPVPKRRARPSKRAIALAEADAFIKARKEGLAAASALYALHIKASGGEKECSATPQSDASITAGDETNVTPVAPVPGNEVKAAAK